MQITPAKSVTPVTSAMATASEGHKIGKNAEIPHLIVARRPGPGAFEDTPRDVLNKAGQDRQAIENAAENLNRLMGLIDKKLEFAVHDKTQRIMIQVIHSDSGQILSEFPSERMLDLYASLVEAIGIAVDEKI